MGDQAVDHYKEEALMAIYGRIRDASRAKKGGSSGG
jgi:hypothetical protein